MENLLGCGNTTFCFGTRPIHLGCIIGESQHFPKNSFAWRNFSEAPPRPACTCDRPPRTFRHRPGVGDESPFAAAGQRRRAGRTSPRSDSLASALPCRIASDMPGVPSDTMGRGGGKQGERDTSGLVKIFDRGCLCPRSRNWNAGFGSAGDNAMALPDFVHESDML